MGVTNSWRDWLNNVSFQVEAYQQGELHCVLTLFYDYCVPMLSCALLCYLMLQNSICALLIKCHLGSDYLDVVPTLLPPCASGFQGSMGCSPRPLFYTGLVHYSHAWEPCAMLWCAETMSCYGNMHHLHLSPCHHCICPIGSLPGLLPFLLPESCSCGWGVTHLVQGRTH